MQPARAAARPAAFRRALVKYCVSALLLVSVLRLVSGHGDWYRAWVYAAVTMGMQVATGVVLQRVHPDLLVERSRIQRGTKRWDKYLVLVVALLGPLAVWCVAAWDVRVRWPPAVPAGWSAVALAVSAAGGLAVFRAMVTNRFFAATVRIQTERGHTVVDRGPYARIRHPGYAGVLAFTLGSPVALGSWWALIPAAATAAVLVVRTALEDRTLRSELAGYEEYTRRVRYRLVPGLW